MRTRAVLVVTAALMWFVEIGHEGAAASATPTAVTNACDISPRSREEITGLLARTDIATPAATTSGQTLPTGTPADAATTAQMEATVHQWLACQNAGEPLRAWALFSDGYLYRLLSRQGGLAPAASSAMATPVTGATDAATLLDFRDPRLLPDGRHGATVVIAYPSVPMPKTFFFYFTTENGRLVIDGILGEISFSVP